ncbi:MAG: acetate--CoA ligase family protein [Candidatus Eremiobacteraeota bacterium]|nr:acetate--CoA ligase family protein [Candidatus Eremiobacteraeota bacterium]
MARLFEYQSKSILNKFKIPVPEGKIADTPESAGDIAREFACPVVVKAQTWTTGRAKYGGIKFADTPEEAKMAAAGIIGKKIKGFTVENVLVEKKLDIEEEYFAGIIIDDSKASPVLIFSSVGGTGIEEIAKEHPDKVIRHTIDIHEGLSAYTARNLVRKVGISGKLQMKIAGILVKLYKAAREYEARSAEINPLVRVKSGDIMAADCHITIDDYAVFRHPDLGIEIARELSNPPTELDMTAFNVEKNDYRGTFYFIQLETDFEEGQGYVGFHGAGGGGSMMSMDAVLAEGFKIANFCDTSGNPPASKVYRAAKIIMAQKGIDGYFGSGSGVASQEQFHSARGLVKAFRENWIRIPVVERLGGNQEEKACDILHNYTKDLPAPVECYGKDTPASYCAKRLRELVNKAEIKDIPKPKEEPHNADYSFQTVSEGTVSFDYDKCRKCISKACIKECIPGILNLNDEGCPVLNISKEDAAKGKCTECLCCEIECKFKGEAGGKIDLPIKELGIKN